VLTGLTGRSGSGLGGDGRSIPPIALRDDGGEPCGTERYRRGVITSLDHAATTPPRPEARAALSSWLDAANASSTHAAGQRHAPPSRRPASGRATALGCSPHEVVFTSGGTEADNLAVKGVVWAARDRGRTVPTSSPPRSSTRPSSSRHGGSRTRRRRPRRSCHPGRRDRGRSTGSSPRSPTTRSSSASWPPTTSSGPSTTSPRSGPRSPTGRCAAHRRGPGRRDPGRRRRGVGRRRAGAVGPQDRGTAGGRRRRPPPRAAGRAAAARRRAGPGGAVGHLRGRAGRRLRRRRSRSGRRPARSSAAPPSLTDRLAAGLTRARRVRRNGPTDPARRLASHVHVSLDGVDPTALSLALDRAGLAASSGAACGPGRPRPPTCSRPAASSGTPLRLSPRVDRRPTRTSTGRSTSSPTSSPRAGAPGCGPDASGPYRCSRRGSA
jgi:cysteine desulfurase